METVNGAPAKVSPKAEETNAVVSPKAEKTNAVTVENLGLGSGVAASARAGTEVAAIAEKGAEIASSANKRTKVPESTEIGASAGKGAEAANVGKDDEVAGKGHFNRRLGPRKGDLTGRKDDSTSKSKEAKKEQMSHEQMECLMVQLQKMIIQFQYERNSEMASTTSYTLLEVCKRRGWTQDDLAKHLTVHKVIRVLPNGCWCAY
jgi:hypothetical protein